MNERSLTCQVERGKEEGGPAEPRSHRERIELALKAHNAGMRCGQQYLGNAVTAGTHLLAIKHEHPNGFRNYVEGLMAGQMSYRQVQRYMEIAEYYSGIGPSPHPWAASYERPGKANL